MDRIINTCPTCQQLIDVSELEPYAKVVCQNCADTIRIRTTFHHFHIREQIGIGGMSRVFRATDTALSRDVALKILNRQCSNDERRVAQFEREARITASMSHPNIVKVFSSAKDQGYFYIAMELVRGGSLDDKIREEKRLSEEQVLDWAIQIAQGLKAALAVGLIHRDIKPGNILFADDGTPKIVDFGLAIMFRKDKDEDKDIWATPYYVPPEKLHGEEEDHRSDIYSLGATLFHALLGKPPFGADTNSLEELKALKSHTVNLSNEDSALISSDTCSMLECCLQKRPEDRYASYDDLIKHLEFAQQQVKTGAAQTGAARRRKQTRQKLLTAAAVVVAAAGGITALALRSSSPPEVHESLEVDSNPASASDTTISSQFSAARDALFRGELPEARKAFHALSESAPRPTSFWALLNSGLCSLLQGDLEASKQPFSRLAQAGTESELDRFFSDVGAWTATPNSVPSKDAEIFPTNSYRAMGLLAVGVKNWQLGDWRNASAVLHRFLAAEPGKGDAWVSNYKALVGPYAQDLKQLDALPPLQTTGLKPEEAKQRLAKAKEAAQNLQLAGAVKTHLEEEINAFAQAVDALMLEEQSAMVEQQKSLRQAEEVRLATARQEAAVSGAGLQFAKGLARMQQEKFEHPDIQKVWSVEVAMWKQAEEFTAQLGRDLIGFEGDLERLSGPPQRGRVLSAAKDGLTIRVPTVAGEALLAFTSMPLPFLVQLEEQYLESDRVSDSDDYYRRRELIVAFCLRTGQNVSGVLRGQWLSRELRTFREKWELVKAAYPID